jgi:putative transposase
MTHEGGHLPRLDRIWTRQPVFFITTCTASRRRELSTPQVHDICREVWSTAGGQNGWRVGRYVLMPDHVHFFCTPLDVDRSLSLFVGKWKEWTAKYAARRLHLAVPLWQEEFFDHVLRSQESYEQKWNYVRDNPVRAGLVANAEDWPYQGEICELRY